MLSQAGVQHTGLAKLARSVDVESVATALGWRAPNSKPQLVLSEILSYQEATLHMQRRLYVKLLPGQPLAELHVDLRLPASLHAPGANTLRHLPMFENEAIVSDSVVAPTVMTLEALQGDMLQLSPPLLLPARQTHTHGMTRVRS